MKVRVTVMTENNTPAEKAGKTKEERNANAKFVWNVIVALLQTKFLAYDETIELESVEVLDDE